MDTRRVADELAIRGLLATYCHRCDDGRLADVVDLFLPDGAFVHGETSATGHAALRAFFEDRQGQPEQRGRHLTVNTVIELDAGTARALSDFVYAKWVDGRIAITVAGRYRDELVRAANGRWHFARRVVEAWSSPEL